MIDQQVADAYSLCTDQRWSRRYIIFGKPCSWKNGKRAFARGGRTHVMHSAASDAWMRAAVPQLVAQYYDGPITCTSLNACVTTYQGARQSIDFDNLLGGPLDALQRAGVILNDYQIVSVDGSRRLRDNLNPRVEIVLTEACD